MPWNRFSPKIGAILIKSKDSDAHFMKMSAKLQFLRDKVFKTGQKNEPSDSNINQTPSDVSKTYTPPPQFYYNSLEKYAVEEILSQNRGHFY